MNKTVLIATKNKGKAREYEEMLAPLGVKVKTLLDIDNNIEIIEDGKTFFENALKKAQTLTDILKTVVIADDSGLVVDYLNGAPGIYSARYSKDHDDNANNNKLLSELKDVPYDKRKAHFHCTIVATAPNKEPLKVSGDVYGYILDKKHGDGGFGYDPLFYYPKFKKTFGELTSLEKNKISHRARALKNLIESFEIWYKKEDEF